MKQIIYTLMSVDEDHRFKINGVEYKLNLYTDLNNNIQATIYKINDDKEIFSCAASVDLEIYTKEKEWDKE